MYALAASEATITMTARLPASLASPGRPPQRLYLASLSAATSAPPVLDGFGRAVLLLAPGLGVFDLTLRRRFRLRHFRLGGFDEFRLAAQLHGPSARTGSGGESFSLDGLGFRLLSHCSHFSRRARRSVLVHWTRLLVGGVRADAGTHDSPTV